MLIKRCSLLFLAWIGLYFTFSATGDELRVETFVMYPQVETLFSTDAARLATLAAFQELKISKVYLESFRSGEIASESLLVQARDFLRDHGIEVSGAVATTSGKGFGQPSNQPGIWFNYQNAKTQQAFAEHFRWIAPLFDEIIIDDFFATDDTSEESLHAKGEASWETYRMNLMMDFAQRFVIKPSRAVHPDLHLILKFPQWYDRFHKFGYDPVRSPFHFDRIWVGTETRNPETLRFGYTMPTMGYINYSWLHSIVGDRIGGGWFDFGDCTPETFLMQGYETILAGADELVLFEAGSVARRHECLGPLQKRLEALFALNRLVHGHKALGITAYKPPYSEGSDTESARNLYVYDYLAVMGLPVVPTAEPPNDGVIFLARQAADDPAIRNRLHGWIASGRTILLTPDFLSALHDPVIFQVAGYSAPFRLEVEETPVQSWIVNEDGQKTTLPADASPRPLTLRRLPLPEKAEILVAASSTVGEIPWLTRTTRQNATLLMLNLATFAHEEFGPEKEQFLPPRLLSIPFLPAQVVQRLQRELPWPESIRVLSPNLTGVCLFENRLLVLANFNSSPVSSVIQTAGSQSRRFVLEPAFPHLPEASLVKQERNGRVEYTATVPPWDLCVIRWD